MLNCLSLAGSLYVPSALSPTDIPPHPYAPHLPDIRITAYVELLDTRGILVRAQRLIPPPIFPLTRTRSPPKIFELTARVELFLYVHSALSPPDIPHPPNTPPTRQIFKLTARVKLLDARWILVRAQRLIPPHEHVAVVVDEGPAYRESSRRASNICKCMDICLAIYLYMDLCIYLSIYLSIYLCTYRCIETWIHIKNIDRYVFSIYVYVYTYIYT